MQLIYIFNVILIDAVYTLPPCHVCHQGLAPAS